MLRHIMLRINGLRKDRIVQLLQCLQNGLPRIAAIMGSQILDVFEQQDGRTSGFDQRRQLKKECALRLVFKAMFTP